MASANSMSTLPGSTGVPGRMRQASILNMLDGRPARPGQSWQVLQTTRTFLMSYFTVSYGRYFDNLLSLIYLWPMDIGRDVGKN